MCRALVFSYASSALMTMAHMDAARRRRAHAVQTLVVVIERRANKLMWVACVLVSVAFLALSFVVVGRAERWLAVGVTVMGATILFTTIGTMLHWVIAHRIEAKRMRSIKRSSLSRSRPFSCPGGVPECVWIDEEFKSMYAI